MPAEEEKQGVSIKVTRRALIASVAVLGAWGAAAVTAGALFATGNNDNKLMPLDDDNTVLSEASTIRPARAIPQGELATINCSSSSADTMNLGFVKGTVRLRITGSWLYETAGAFERTEGVSITENAIDKWRIEGEEDFFSRLKADPDKAEEERQHRLWLWATGEQQARVDDLQEEYSYRRKEFLYDEDGSRIRFAATTQDLLDLGYKLLSVDLEIGNVDAVVLSDEDGGVADCLLEGLNLARGSDVAVFEQRYFLVEGENDPSVDTLSSNFPVPQGEQKRFHIVWAVSPRSLKGELSLFLGEPLWAPTLTDEVVLLAIDPEIVT